MSPEAEAVGLAQSWNSLSDPIVPMVMCIQADDPSVFWRRMTMFLAVKCCRYVIQWISTGTASTCICQYDFAGISFFFLSGRTIHYRQHMQRNKNTSVKWTATRSGSCKLPSRLGKRQTLKPAKSQHITHNKPSAKKLFTNSKHSSSIFTEQTVMSNNVQIHTIVA